MPILFLYTISTCLFIKGDSNMTINEILSKGGDLEVNAKAFIKASSVFIDTLAKNNITLDMGVSDSSAVDIDYDAPIESVYKKTYRPIDSSEIIKANKEMSEAISGEKWISGFVTCIQLIMMFAPK